MNKRHILPILIVLCLATLHLSAKPAKGVPVLLYQPDGSSFIARLVGDEYQHLMLTNAGNAVVQDPDGWYSYQLFSPDGSRRSSGVHVGPKADASAVAASLDIPYTRIREIALEKRGSLPAPEKNLMQRFAEAKSIDFSAPVTKGLPPAEKHGLAILVSFKDLAFNHTRAEFQNLLTKSGYSVNGATGCAKEYFDAQFAGKVNFHFDVTDIVTVSQNMAYYGGNDSNDQDKAPELMIKEACLLVDDKVDFSIYDDDGDGEVDNVFVFFAGADEAEYGGDDCIWSHAWALKGGAGITLRLDGKIIDSYACTSELSATRYISDGKGGYKGTDYVMAGIGTFCHEYSHTMGLPDLYDTNYDDDGSSDALWGSTSLMDAGSYNNGGNTPPFFNAVEREIMGLVEPENIATGTFSLGPVSSSNRAFKVQGRNDGEYYLIESRSNTGWDRYIGGKGLLVYHVDKSMNKVSIEGHSYSAQYLWNELNCVNANRSHQCVDILEANPSANGKYSSRSDSGGGNTDIFFPYSNYRSITPDTAQKLKFWNGDVADVTITNIAISGTDVTMTVFAGGVEAVPPVVKALEIARFQDAAIVSFASSREFDGEAYVRYGLSGKNDKTRISVLPYESGKYAVVIEELAPKTSYEVQINFVLDGIEGEQTSNRFMTLSNLDEAYPYISFRDVPRTADGVISRGTRIPLRIGGISGYDGVTWSLDGEEIGVGPDCYYTTERSGRLRADIAFKDGSHEIIVKELVVR